MLEKIVKRGMKYGNIADGAICDSEENMAFGAVLGMCAREWQALECGSNRCKKTAASL
jgi:hypothetical protein